jgi:hypothetical protein
MNGRAVAEALYGGQTPQKRTTTVAVTVSKAFMKSMMDAEAPEPSGEQYADRWDPEANPIIAGELVSIEEVSTSNGPGMRLTVNDQGPDKLGEVSFFANTVIGNAIEKQKIVEGETVGLKYLGEVQGKKFVYKNYFVKVDRPEATPPLPNTEDEEADVDPFMDE